ncbi:MAG TPA: ABC transporter substrate-binding protein [Verrucomicrobiae bacterium]|nr:ABC transporter substrate-binding protein [Verrucomicrobiae bacterium]
MKRRGCLAFLLFLVLVTRSFAAEKVRLSYSSRSNSVTPFQVAVVRGFYREEGLDVEMIQVNPRLGAMAVMNGDLDFTTTFGSTLRGVIQGLPLKFVAVSVKKSEHFLIARRDIKDVQDLKGKKIAVSTLLGTDQIAAEEIARSKGFNAALMQPIAVGDAPLRAQALRSGIVDASSISSPHDMILKDEGFNVLGGPEDVKYALPTSGIAVAVKLLQEKPQIVKQLIRALLKAHRFVFENRAETIQIMMRWLTQTPEVAAHSYQLELVSLARNGEITDYEWERLTEGKKPLAEVRDFTLLRQAQKELGIRQ